MKTLGEMFLFHINHKALHMGTINMLKRTGQTPTRKIGVFRVS